MSLWHIGLQDKNLNTSHKEEFRPKFFIYHCGHISSNSKQKGIVTSHDVWYLCKMIIVFSFRWTIPPPKKKKKSMRPKGFLAAQKIKHAAYKLRSCNHVLGDTRMICTGCMTYTERKTSMQCHQPNGLFGNCGYCFTLTGTGMRR